MRVGIGYDVHRLVKDRKLILGGVNIDYKYGLLGHSDADVLVHAIIDSLLGASGQGDLGRHFPDNDNKFKDISSLKLLEYTRDLLAKNNYSINNIDCIIVAQEPKVSPYIEEMIINISESLRIEPSCINIKATTEEGLGFTGERLGISAHAVCLIK